MSQHGAQSLDDLLSSTSGASGAAAGADAPGEADLSQRRGDGPPTRTRRERHRHSAARKALLVLGVLVVLLGLMAAGAAVYVQRVTASLDANIERIGDPFEAIPEESRPVPQPAAADAVNILMVGSDSRISAGDPTQWVAGAQRTDTIMVLHIPSDRSGASVISIPRDSWVDIPGHGENKINAAFSFGGPTLMIQTIENYTGVRIDHFVVLDFEGFVAITDALGGVRIKVPRATGDKRGSFPAGTYTMDGASALTYVRQRYNLPGGDFDRVRRQQNWIRAVAKELLSRGTLTNPGRLTDALDALTRSVATDDAFTIGEMRGLAFDSRDVRAGDLAFFTAPVAGTARSPNGKQSIVTLDEELNASLWKAVADDDVDAWVATNQPDLLGETVR